MISVITTIAPPTNSVQTLSKKLGPGQKIVIIGDKKGPFSYELENTEFYSLEDQLRLKFNIIKDLPVGHYARKNVGYLLAMQQGENCIYETDDDNHPNKHWRVRTKEIEAVVANKSQWINVYKHFSKENIWPRGLLLDQIANPDSIPKHNSEKHLISAPIQQGLADVAPDVDAIWRLTQDREFYFDRNESIALPEGAWCPFNTQTTWWWKEAFPLLYLPSYCSFRMTDIWKSFIAQRCIWEMGHKIVFHPSEVDQDRNVHNLMRDFEAEVSGYTQNEKLTSVLENSQLLSGSENTLRNLIVCYENLIKEEIFPQKEMPLVKAWANDLETILYKNN